MKEQLVLVKDADGEPLLRRVCHVTSDLVFVASDLALKRINAGDQTFSQSGSGASVFPLLRRRFAETNSMGKIEALGAKHSSTSEPCATRPKVQTRLIGNRRQMASGANLFDLISRV